MASGGHDGSRLVARRTLLVRLEPDQAVALVRVAKRRGRKVSELVRGALVAAGLIHGASDGTIATGADAAAYRNGA